MKSTLLATSLFFACSGALAHGDNFSFGAGIGQNFGVIGVSGDLPVTKDLYFTVGLGVVPSALLNETATGYNIGAAYYLRDSNVTWRPRLLLQYGTTAAVETICLFGGESCNDGIETFESVTIGFGQSIAFGQSKTHGLSFDLLYNFDTQELEDHLSEVSNNNYQIDGDTSIKKVLLSIGYKMNF